MNSVKTNSHADQIIIFADFEDLGALSRSRCFTYRFLCCLGKITLINRVCTMYTSAEIQVLRVEPEQNLITYGCTLTNNFVMLVWFRLDTERQTELKAEPEPFKFKPAQVLYLVLFGHPTFSS